MLPKTNFVKNEIIIKKVHYSFGIRVGQKQSLA